MEEVAIPVKSRGRLLNDYEQSDDSEGTAQVKLQRSRPLFGRPWLAPTKPGLIAVSGSAPSVLGVNLRHLTIALSAALPCASLAQGQACDSVSSRTSMSAFAGVPIRSVKIVTQGPPAFPGVARALDNLHVRTREATIRRQIRFQPGDTLDT